MNYSVIEKKVFGKFKIETLKIIWIDEFVCLRSKTYSFKCGDDSKNISKAISQSQSKHIKFDEQENFLEENDNKKECELYILRSINQEVYLQKVNSSTLSLFDDRKCY